MSTEVIAVSPAGGVLILVFVPEPLRRTVVVESWVTSTLKLPGTAVLSVDALPTAVLERVVVCELKSVGDPKACKAVLRLPKLVPRSPKSVLFVVSVVSSV